MIEARDLTRLYGDFTAVADVSFSIDEGEIVGILGPNGAGKTTTIRMITGFLPPTAGQVTIAGHDLLSDPLKARRQIGYLPENVALYPEMRVREYLAYRARLAGMARRDAGDAIDRTIESCLLTDVEWQIIGTLSKGYRQRVGLAAAILHGPRVLVLDEPTVGLDPKQIIAIRELIRNLGQDRTLLLSTHILPEVEQLCDRVLIIDRGRLIAEGTAAELRAESAQSPIVRVTLDSAPENAADVLGALPGVAAVRTVAANGVPNGVPNVVPTGESRFTVEGEAGEDVRGRLFHAAVDQGWTLLELAEQKASLEDVFVRLTAHADPAADASPTTETTETTETAETTDGEDAR